MDDQRLRPHSTLIRQSSWSGLSESSSHESLTGSLVKSNSLSSMKTPSDSKTQMVFVFVFVFVERNSLTSCRVPSRPTEVRLCKNTALRNAATNGCDDPVSRKPPIGRRDTSTPPPAPPGGVLVQRSQVCLSTFYKDCAESADSESDCSCQPVERDGRLVMVGKQLNCFFSGSKLMFDLPSSLTSRPAGTRDTAGRNKVVDENYNNVASPSRGGLAGKLQQLLTPTRHRVSVRRAASVDDRRPGGGAGIGRRVSEQRQSRKAQVAETLLKAKERLVSATSEVCLKGFSLKRTTCS